jgi:raffinose/stachyose/melibiose transport system substrate-binding protein
MRSRNKLVAITTSAILLAGLAGCSAGGGSGSGKTEITWWKLTETAESANAAIEEIVADFEADNPDISVNVEERSVDGHKDALRTAIGTAGAPDVFFSWAGRGLGGEFVDAGASLDLEKYYEKYGWNDRFSEATLAPIQQYGGYNGVPYTQRGEALFYRKDSFEKAGITQVPTTYDELVAANDKLVDAGITPIQFGGTVNWHLMRLLDNILETECGADTFDALVSKKASWADEECVTATFTEFEKWTDKYVNKGFVSINNDESSSLLYSGDAAMALEGDWFNQVLRDNDQDENNYGIMQFPTGTGRLYGFVEANYISANSKHPDEAAKFLDFITNDVEQPKFIKAFGSQSVNVNVKAAADQSALDASWTPIFTESKGLFMNNDQNLSLAETTEYWRVQNLVATGELDPKKAGAEFQKFIDQQ